MEEISEEASFTYKQEKTKTKAFLLEQLEKEYQAFAIYDEALNYIKRFY